MTYFKKYFLKYVLNILLFNYNKFDRFYKFVLILYSSGNLEIYKMQNNKQKMLKLFVVEKRSQVKENI